VPSFDRLDRGHHLAGNASVPYSRLGFGEVRGPVAFREAKAGMGTLALLTAEAAG